MADLLIFEFSAPQAVELYHQVNALLGVDPSSPAADWPAGMLSHQAGSEGDSLIVVESWQSREAQEDFMSTRLGPALSKADVPPPTRVTWLSQVAAWQRG
jgi:hypothetical protein